MQNSHVLQDSGSIVGYDDLSGSGLDLQDEPTTGRPSFVTYHLVHAFWSQTGSYGV